MAEDRFLPIFSLFMKLTEVLSRGAGVGVKVGQDGPVPARCDEFKIRHIMVTTGDNIDVEEDGCGSVFCAMLALGFGEHLHGPKHRPTGHKPRPTQWAD